MIYPGIAKMAEWAGATEKQARNNMRQIERWGVAIPVANQEGGRGNSTEYVIDLKALFSVLNLMECKPTDLMRGFAVEKAEIVTRILYDYQVLSQSETRNGRAEKVDASNLLGKDAKPGTTFGQNPEVNPEETSARIRDNTGPLPHLGQPGDSPPSASPAAGRSAGASLSSIQLKKKTRGGCKADHCARTGAATPAKRDDPTGLKAAFVAFGNEFDLMKIYPRQSHDVLKVQAAWSEATERGLKPHELIQLAVTLRQQVEAGALDLQRLPELHIWIGKITWPEPDQTTEAAE